MEKKAKFGSLEWQKEMAKKIAEKITKSEKLDDFEIAFINVQNGGF